MNWLRRRKAPPVLFCYHKYWEPIGRQVVCGRDVWLLRRCLVCGKIEDGNILEVSDAVEG